jgi:MFS family permease
MGGGIGLGIRRIIDSSASADNADAIIILVAACGYLAAAIFASLLKKAEIGPRPHEIAAASFSQGFTEMRDGFKFLERHTDAARGIIATALHRGGLTALVLTALLLERNAFHDPADSEAGLSGLSITLSIAAIGFGIGALTAPFGVRKFGRHRWMRIALFASALGPVFLIFARTPITLSITAFLTALCGQNLKVTNDALVQSKISDEYRGRVFSVYDVVVNAAIIVGALTSALILPTDGDTPFVPLIVSILYLVTAIRLLRPSIFTYKTI